MNKRWVKCDHCDRVAIFFYSFRTNMQRKGYAARCSHHMSHAMEDVMTSKDEYVRGMDFLHMKHIMES